MAWLRPTCSAPLLPLFREQLMIQFYEPTSSSLVLAHFLSPLRCSVHHCLRSTSSMKPPLKALSRVWFSFRILYVVFTTFMSAFAFELCGFFTNLPALKVEYPGLSSSPGLGIKKWGIIKWGKKIKRNNYRCTLYLIFYTLFNLCNNKIKSLLSLAYKMGKLNSEKRK